MNPLKTFPLRSYDLSATLNSGQAFRWKADGPAWTGVIGNRWLRLCQRGHLLSAETSDAVSDWDWLTEYLQLEADFEQILQTFPNDAPMRAAVAACQGLRLLR